LLSVRIADDVTIQSTVLVTIGQSQSYVTKRIQDYKKYFKMINKIQQQQQQQPFIQDNHGYYTTSLLTFSISYSS